MRNPITASILSTVPERKVISGNNSKISRPHSTNIQQLFRGITDRRSCTRMQISFISVVHTKFKFFKIRSSIVQNSYWLFIKEKRFSRVPTRSRNSNLRIPRNLRAIGSNSLMMPLNFMLFVPKWLHASRVCHLFG